MGPDVTIAAEFKPDIISPENDRERMKKYQAACSATSMFFACQVVKKAPATARAGSPLRQHGGDERTHGRLRLSSQS